MSPSPSEGRDCSLEWSPPTTVMYALMCCSEGATVLMAIGSSCNSIAFVAHDAHCISSAVQNKTTDSIAKYWSTPKGLSVPQCYTYFHNVLLCNRGDIEQSAIFLH